MASTHAAPRAPSRPIPDDWRERAPAMSEAAWAGLCRVLEHADAPRYNRTMGDRVGEAELAALGRFRHALEVAPREAEAAPSSRVVDVIESLRGRVFLLEGLPRGFDARRDFEELPTTSRDDLVRGLVDLVPRDLDLAPAIVYSTSSTTGHAVLVLSHPAAMVQNLAHLEAAARLYGVRLAGEAGVPYALNMTAQRDTYVFATTMSGWDGAVFAKVNLAEHGWSGGVASRARFLAEFAPRFVASEPVTLSEAIRLELPLRPEVVVSSAVHLSAAARAHVEASWGAAVLDLYSMTETGPIAVSVPGVEGHVVLVPDLFVEVLGPDGERLPDGELGEITVTGGRNPYLPLLRYRTGDRARLGTITLPDGRPARVLRDLEGRRPVTFRTTRGEPLGSVDIARRIRPLAPFVQHALVQRADGAVELRLRPIPGVPLPKEPFLDALHALFGRDARVSVHVDPSLGAEGGKVIPWRSELEAPAHRG